MEVSEIIDMIDMVEYVSQYIDLEEKGGEFWGLSPWKEEKTPSFSIRPDAKIFCDFSSGKSGNLVDFVMAYHHKTVYEAVQILKQYAHISEKDGQVTVRLEASRVAKRYRHQEKRPPKCIAKTLPDNYMDRYEFRRDKLQVWADEDITWDSMKRFGVRYDAFDDRIVYPIRDLDGNIISVCGRTLDPDFKEKRIRKYTYLNQIGTIATMCCFWENKEEILNRKELVLFEGFKSCLKMDGWGYHNTAGIMTSHLSQNQFEFLVKLANFHGVRIVFALDSDVDITKDDNIKRLMHYATVEWVCNQDDVLDEKMAPVDAGKEIWDQLYRERRRLN